MQAEMDSKVAVTATSQVLQCCLRVEGRDVQGLRCHPEMVDKKSLQTLQVKGRGWRSHKCTAFAAGRGIATISN